MSSVKGVSVKQLASFDLLRIGICIFLAMSSLFLLGRTAYARFWISRSTSQYAIVSSRPKVEDLSYIQASQEDEHLRYYREDEPFAQGLIRQSKLLVAGSSKPELRVFEFRRSHYVGEAPLAQGIDAVETQIGLFRIARDFPLFAVLTGIGLALGVLVPVPWRWFPSLMMCAGLTASVKYVTDCPTCPRASLWGLDISLLGIGVFGVLWLLASLCRNERFLAASNVILCAVVVFQLYSSRLAGSICVPCLVICFISSLALASSLSWREGSEMPTGLLPKALPWIAALCVPAVIYASAPGGLVAGLPDVSTSAPQYASVKPVKVKSVNDLGLKPPGRLTILYVGRFKCEACTMGIAAIDQAGISGLTFACVGSPTPDSHHAWTTLPNSKSIAITPTVLYIRPDGQVESQEFGFPSTVDGLSHFASRVDHFLHSAAH